MYLRETKNRRKDGSEARYLQLAHNVRHPETGQSTAGIPVRLWVWPGTTQDQTVVAEVKRCRLRVQLGRQPSRVGARGVELHRR